MLYLEVKTITFSFYFKVFSVKYSKYLNYFIKTRKIKSLEAQKKFVFNPIFQVHLTYEMEQCIE
jgi:hypothetical protein